MRRNLPTSRTSLRNRRGTVGKVRFAAYGASSPFTRAASGRAVTVQPRVPCGPAPSTLVHVACDLPSTHGTPATERGVRRANAELRASVSSSASQKHRHSAAGLKANPDNHAAAFGWAIGASS